jgi:hypothetical protein
MPPSKLSGDVIDVVQQKHGIRVVFGRWLVKGYPKVFLIDMKSSWHRLDEWRATLMGSFAVRLFPAEIAPALRTDTNDRDHP